LVPEPSDFSILSPLPSLDDEDDEPGVALSAELQPTIAKQERANKQAALIRRNVFIKHSLFEI
jgi:hypothetical protein